jgi:nucleoside-diphosphate-sugar epimerase
MDKETSISFLFEILKKIHLNYELSKNKKIHDDKNNPQINSIFSDEAKGGTYRRLPDISKLGNLGYSPKILLLEGLTKTYQWMAENPDYYRQSFKK